MEKYLIAGFSVLIALQQAIYPVHIPLAATAQAASAPVVSTEKSNYNLNLNTQNKTALELRDTRPTFDTAVLAPLKAAQEAKAQADAEAAAAQAAAEAAAAAAAPKVTYAPVEIPTLSGGDAEYKLFIYNHESGNNPTRRNGSGCLGLGQACPGQKLLNVCPSLDYACEDAFFTNYALSRYGSWAGAYAFWVAHRYW